MTTDPRWQNPRIIARREASHAVEGAFSADNKAKMLAHIEGQLRAIGVTHVTEDLILLLWAGLLLSMDFIATSIELTCVNPNCGFASMGHAAAGIDMLGMILFALEEKIGQAL